MKAVLTNGADRKSQWQHEDADAGLIGDLEEGLDKILKHRPGIICFIQKIAETGDENGGKNIDDERLSSQSLGIIGADVQEDESLADDRYNEQSQCGGCQARVIPVECPGAEGHADDVRTQDDKKRRHRQ